MKVLCALLGSASVEMQNRESIDLVGMLTHGARLEGQLALYQRCSSFNVGLLPVFVFPLNTYDAKQLAAEGNDSSVVWL